MLIDYTPLNEKLFPASDYEIMYEMFEETEWGVDRTMLFDDFYNNMLKPYLDEYGEWTIYSKFENGLYDYLTEHGYVSPLHILKDLKGYFHFRGIKCTAKMMEDNDTIKIIKISD